MQKMQFAYKLGTPLLFGILAAAFAAPASAQTPGCQPFASPLCVHQQVFTPAGTTALAASSVSSNVALPASGSTLYILVTNASTVTAYVALGTSNSITATTSSTPLLPGIPLVLPQGTYTYLAAITASGSAALSITSGTGVPTISILPPNLPAIPAASTPTVGTAAAIVTGGSAVTLITGPVNGCIIQNPTSASDQNIVTAEVAYINGVTTATANGRGTNTLLNPGDVWRCVPGQTTNVSVIAATTAHAFSVEKW